MSASGEENSYKSAKDCFVETLRSNTATLRLKIKSPDLVNEEIFIGRQSKTRISLCYMKNICNEAYIKTIRDRIVSINCDAFLSLDDILPYLVEKKYTIFPQSYTTEKPVLYAAALLEGRIGVMVDGIPYGIVLPATFQDFFQSSYDYATDFISATLFRISRYALALVAFFLPGFYAAITTFHQEVLPYSLAYTIITSKQRTPFPIVAELIIMSIAFYTLIEAAMRTPSSITPTVSIVGGLILGEAAISSNLISPGVIVVVAMAAVASLTISNRELSNALWLCQIFNTILCSIWGFFGGALCLMLVTHHLCSLENMGLSYFSPFVGGQKRSYRDSIIKFPSFLTHKRPAQFHPKDKTRRRG